MTDERTSGPSAPNGLLGRMRGARGTVLRLATVKLKRPAAAMLRATPEGGRIHGVSEAAADKSECRCPDFCERDHANE